MPLLAAENLQKTYVTGEARVTALAGVSFAVERGDFVALMGPSGCGKSTLLHFCGAMDRPTGGTLRLDDRDLSAMGDDELTRVRREQVGFVFQFFNLLPTLTVSDNIALPCLLAGVKPARGGSGAPRSLADRVGIAHRLKHYPQQISGGEMQRAAIARALVHRPSLLVADEPTGNLDSENGANVLALLSELNKEMRVTVLLATHAADVAAAADRVLTMKDGRFAQTCFRKTMRLFHQFIIRPLAGEKIRTATTVLGVALGIAVVIAIQLTNASSVRGFETALETVAGKTAVEIIGAGTGVDETRLPELSWLREFGVVSPVIEGTAALVIGDVKSLMSRRQLEAVKVLGIDILRDQPFRDYQLLELANVRQSRRLSHAVRQRQALSRRHSHRRLHDATVSRDPDQRTIRRDHREARQAAQLSARRRAAADDRRPRAALRRARLS